MSERETLHGLGQIPVFSIAVAALFLWILWQGLKAWRDGKGLYYSFAPAAALLVFVVCFVAWIGYFGDHGWFIRWQLIMFGLPTLILLPFVIIKKLRQLDDLKKLRAMQGPENTSGPAKPDAFKDWV